MKSAIGAVAAFLAIGCGQPSRPAGGGSAPINTATTDVAPDRAADSLLVDVRALDSTIVVDMRYATSNNFTGAPLPGYLANRAYLRREAAAALARVQRGLAGRGFGLKVFDAYRPVRATLAMVEWTRRVNRTDLLTDGYIATRSGHNLGLAVDLTVVDRATGRELDMGTAFDVFTPAAHTDNATGVIAANRQLLRAAMEREGLMNYPKEWWHFSMTVPSPLRFDRPVVDRADATRGSSYSVELDPAPRLIDADASNGDLRARVTLSADRRARKSP